MTLAFGPLWTTCLKVFTHPQKRSDREQVSNKVAGVWIETEMDLQVLPRLHICIWYHRLDEFRTGSAHFCAVCDGLTIHFWELIYRVQLLSSMCVFLNWFFLEGTALQYVLRTWSLVDRTFRRVGMWNIGIKGLPWLPPFCGQVVFAGRSNVGKSSLATDLDLVVKPVAKIWVTTTASSRKCTTH